MTRKIHTLLSEIERAYHDGAKYDAICEKIHRAAELIASLDGDDLLRKACEEFAPLLWGGDPGSAIEPKAVQAALAGQNGNAHLRSWSGIGRVLLAYRAAA